MLKSNKGITMTSLVIYIIVLMIVIALMSTFVGYFFKNVKDITYVEDSDEYYSRFMAYLTKDLTADADKICFIASDNDNTNNTDYLIIKFKENTKTQSEHQYIYEGETVYYLDINNNKKIHLCDTVTNCNFSNVEHSVTVNMTINNKNYTKTIYTNP